MKKCSGRLIAASPAVCADVLYAGGFHAPDEVIYFEIGHEKGLILSQLEFARGQSEAKRGVQVLSRESFLEGSADRSDLAVLKNLTDKLGVTRWDVPANFPLALADALRGSDVEICALPDPFFPKRQVKTAAELRKIAEAEAVTEDSMRYARDLIRSAQVNSKGVLTRNGKVFTCDMLRAEIEGFLKQHGYTAEQTITACGEDASQPHNLGSGPLLAGKPIVIDIFPRSDRSGYWGDMTRTFCKGKALPVVRKAFKSVLKASEIAQKMIRAGVCAADVHRAAAELMASDGFLTGHTPDGIPCGFIHGLGHGLGLEIHEGPRVSPINSKPLAAGNVVSVEPGLYHPSWGGIRLEDIVAVTQDGCHNFNTMEKELELD